MKKIDYAVITISCGILCFAVTIAWILACLFYFGASFKTISDEFLYLISMKKMDGLLIVTSLFLAPIIETFLVFLIAIMPLRYNRSALLFVFGLSITFIFAIFLHGGRLLDVGRALAFCVLYIQIYSISITFNKKVALTSAIWSHAIWNILAITVMYLNIY